MVESTAFGARVKEVARQLLPLAEAPRDEVEAYEPAAFETAVDGGDVEPGATFEPFLQDWYPARAPEVSRGTLLLTNRQLAIIGFLIVGAMAILTVMAYAAGRLASGEPGRIVMVESAAVPVKAAPPATTTSATATLAPVQVAGSRDERPSPTGGNTVGTSANSSAGAVAESGRQSYWQVGSLDSGMAEVSKKYLEGNSLSVLLDPVVGTNQVRVLVGPALEGAELNDLKQKLDALGFQAFLKRL